MAIKVEMTAEDKELIAAYKAQQKEIAKQLELLKKLGEVSTDTANKQHDGIKQAITSLQTMAAGYLSISTALKLVNAELQKKRDLEKAAAGAQVEVAPAQQRAMANMAAAPEAERKFVRDEVAKIARDRRVPESTIYDAFTAGASARGGASFKGVVGAVGTAAKLYANNPEMIASYAGGTLDVANMTGMLEDKDMAANSGFLAGVQYRSRLESTESLTKHGVPAMKGVMGYGASAQEAGALFGTLSNVMADPEGALAKTSSIAMAQGLAKFLPELKGFSERVQHMQQHPELLEKFFKTPGISFEKQSLIPVQNLLTKGSGAADLLASNTQNLLSPQQSGGILDPYFSEMAQLDPQMVADVQRAGKTATDVIGRADPSLAVRGESREQARKAIRAAGASPFWQGTQEYLNDIKGSFDGEQSNDPVRELEAHIRSITNYVATGEKRDNLTAQERENVATLQELIRVIKQQTEQAKSNTAALEKRNRQRPVDTQAHAE